MVSLKFFPYDPFFSAIGWTYFLISSTIGKGKWFFESRRVSKLICQTLYKCNLVEIEKDKNGNPKVIYPKTTIKTNGYNLYINFGMLIGQTQAQWQSKIDAFAHALGGELISYEVDRGNVYLVVKIAKRTETKLCVKNDDLHYLGIGYDDEGRQINWYFDESPHMLLIGATGSGKSTFIRSLISQFPTDWDLELCDGKIIEFDWLRDHGYTVIDGVDGFVKSIEKAKQEVDKRFNQMRKEMTNNYKEIGLQPRFLVIDEFIYLMESVSAKKAKGEAKSKRDEVFDLLRDISLRGRAAGVFLVLILQRPDSAFLPTVIRDNLTAKIALANSGETGLEMAFGSAGKALAALDRGEGYYKDGLNGDIRRFGFGHLDMETFKRIVRANN